MKRECITLMIAVLLLLSACGKKQTTVPATKTEDDADKSAGGNTCNAKIADVENMTIFPADNAWNQDVSTAAVDQYSDQIIAAISSFRLKADFGSGLYEGVPIGIPFDVVCGNQTKVKVIFRANQNDGNYGDESDQGPYPIPPNAHIEGNGSGDSHVIVVDRDNSMLYELYNASYSGGNWGASSGAIFNLKSNTLRKEGWTSADAAGLPIFPGLVRYDEVLKGTIDHAIRFTLQLAYVKPAYIAPARHSVNSHGGQYSLPFGAKIRLKAGFNLTGYPAHLQVILKAMKKYGLILADIGSNMYISGAPDNRWNNDELQKLGNIKASDFEVVKFN
ncbi:MAG: hypothetical protein ACTHMI_16265 [Mucilaginibacter sp.]